MVAGSDHDIHSLCFCARNSPSSFQPEKMLGNAISLHIEETGWAPNLEL